MSNLNLKGGKVKKIVECDEVDGLEGLLGEEVILLCASYFYTGKLIGVNDKFVKLSGARLVYETGNWDSKNYADAQALPKGIWFIHTAFIESYGASK